MPDWFQDHHAALWWLIGISAVTFLVSALSVPWLVARMPANYFSPSAVHEKPFAHLPKPVRIALLVGKNLLGVLFVVLGILMLVLPGQGVLTILAGVVLIDFPGRRRALEWFVGHDTVLHALNWIRKRAKREPLVVDPK
jgi:hypothetical protein